MNTALMPFTSTRRLLYFLFCFSFLLGMSLPGYSQNAPTLPQEKTQSNSPVINLNTTDAKTIASAHIKGIGKKRAEAIVAYRTQHGPFKSVDDLKNIKGISEKVINANRDKLVVK